MNLKTLIPALFLISLPSLAQEPNYNGGAIYQGRNNSGVVVTIYDEPCKFTNVVSNMPYRATWVENGAKSEGCVMAHPIAMGRAQVFAFWFDDKTVFVELMQVFTPVKSM